MRSDTIQPSYMLDLRAVGPKFTRPTCRAVAAAIDSKSAIRRHGTDRRTDGRTLGRFMTLVAYNVARVKRTTSFSKLSLTTARSSPVFYRKGCAIMLKRFGDNRMCSSGDMPAERQTQHRQSDRHVYRNTPPPLTGCSNNRTPSMVIQLPCSNGIALSLGVIYDGIL